MTCWFDCDDDVMSATANIRFKMISALNNLSGSVVYKID